MLVINEGESTLSVPCSPQNLTAEWLSDAMRPALPDGTDVSELSWNVIGEEWGFTGVIARVYPRYAPYSVKAPPSLVAKFPMAVRSSPSHYQQLGNRDKAARLRAYDRSAREVLFYHQIVPHGRVPAPHLFYGAADDHSRCIILLLEDLGRGGVGDVLQACSPAQAEAILGTIAPFHALWWRSSHLDTLTWLPRWGLDLADHAERYARSVEPFLDRFDRRLPVGAAVLIRALTGQALSLFSELAAAPATIIHGDLHLDNVIFCSDVHSPSIRILDWQSVMRGPAVLDLGIVTALPPELRRISEHRLLAYYHALLMDRGVTDYPMNLFERHYDLGLLAGLVGIVTWLGNAKLDGMVGREGAIVDSLIEESRLLHALLDRNVVRML